MTYGRAPMCMFCARFDFGADELRCTAFPDGIPDDIIDSDFDHRQPHDGDGGLQYLADRNHRPPRPEYIDELFAPV